MKFTGDNLLLVRRGLDLALDELQTQIGVCPDVKAQAKELDALKVQKHDIKRLLGRIERAMKREQPQ